MSWSHLAVQAERRILNEAIERRIVRLGGESILRRSQAAQTTVGVLRVLDLMLDEQPHAAHEIRRAAGGEREASEGLRRMRELRSLGFMVERIEGADNEWRYRLRVPQRQHQQSLFGDEP
jgi:hypothetical protein